MPIANSNPASFQMPGMNGNMPNLNLPQLQGVNTNPDPTWASSPIYNTLTQAAPQSLTNLIGPLLQQIYGTQGNLMQPIFQQQTNQGIAQAQSNAQQRGLTGSTIEQAGLQGAQTQGNQAFDQYLAGQLNQLVPQFSQAAQFDIGNQSQYYGNIAQGIGQQMSQQEQLQMFLQQLGSTQAMARSANTAGLEGAGISAFGNILANSKYT